MGRKQIVQLRPLEEYHFSLGHRMETTRWSIHHDGVMVGIYSEPNSTITICHSLLEPSEVKDIRLAIKKRFGVILGEIALPPYIPEDTEKDEPQNVLNEEDFI